MTIDRAIQKQYVYWPEIPQNRLVWSICLMWRMYSIDLTHGITFFGRHLYSPLPLLTSRTFGWIDDYGLLSFSTRFTPFHHGDDFWWRNTLIACIASLFATKVKLDKWKSIHFNQASLSLLSSIHIGPSLCFKHSMPCTYFHSVSKNHTRSRRNKASIKPNGSSWIYLSTSR
jgi:hypothetical protein